VCFLLDWISVSPNCFRLAGQWSLWHALSLWYNIQIGMPWFHVIFFFVYLIILSICHCSMVILWSYFAYSVVECTPAFILPIAGCDKSPSITIFNFVIKFYLYQTGIFTIVSSILSCPYWKSDISLSCMGENKYSHVLLLSHLKQSRVCPTFWHY
jgi:hypothetical protein